MKGLSSEATGTYTWDNYEVQERDKWTPNPSCSLFLVTLSSSVMITQHSSTTEKQRLTNSFLHLSPEQQNYMGSPPAARSKCSERLEGPPKLP